MIVKEYRVLLPLEVEEYQRGQLFSVAEASKNETGGGEGVEVLKQESFTSDTVRPGHNLTGTYTHKIYRLKSKMPWIIQKLLPDAAMNIEESAWNAYPYCKTVVTNPGYMKDNFYIVIESIHLPDNGTTENALNCSKEILEQCEIVVLDIFSEDNLDKKTDLKPETDPRIFKSEKTGRGPLAADWSKTVKPIMCCYKLVTAHFKWMGFQSKIEKMIHKNYPRLFLKFNRELYCWIDKWYSLTMEDIRRMEEETAEKLKNQIQKGSVRGMCAETNSVRQDT